MQSAEIVGEKMAKTVKSLLPCTPYSIYDCTVDRYVSIFVENQISNIIKKGFCTREQKIEFINDLSFAFSEAKGDLVSTDVSDREKLIKLTFEIQRLQIALLIFIRDFEYCLSIFKDLGLKTNFKEPTTRVVDFINSQIKRRQSDIKNINARLFKESKDKEKITRQLYVDILENYDSNIHITLSEFAAKIKKNKKLAEEYEKIRGNNK